MRRVLFQYIKVQAPTLHGYCCYVPQAIIYIGVIKQFTAEFEWLFAMIKQNISFKSIAIYD